jgi:hypothetical protein
MNGLRDGAVGEFRKQIRKVHNNSDWWMLPTQLLIFYDLDSIAVSAQDLELLPGLFWMLDVVEKGVKVFIPSSVDVIELKGSPVREATLDTDVLTQDFE